MSVRGIFVTGTDTGVGKTLVACALLHACATRGLRGIGMKPVAAGAVEKNAILVNDDVEQLIAASSTAAPRGDINPYCFALPIAPHIAAQSGTINIDKLHDSYQRLSALSDMVVVEGVGGFCVPFNALETSADFAQQLALPVVMVVGLRLGCLSHALLTAEAIRARGLALAGWVANHVDPLMSHADANVEALATRLGAPLLARIAYTLQPDAAVVAQQMDINTLLSPGKCAVSMRRGIE